MEKPCTKRIWRCVHYYLALCQAKGQAPDTLRGKRSGLKKFYLWCLPQQVYTIEQITLDLLDNYMEYLNHYRKPLDHQPLGQQQKRNLVTYIKTFVQYMYSKGLLSANTLAGIELPHSGRALPKALFSVAEIEKILAQSLLFGVHGLRDRAILEVFFATGIRRSELMMLDIDDIDFTAKLLRVNHGKGQKERIVPISKRACEWLVFYLSKLRPMISFIGSGGALFLANNGTRLRANQLSEMAGRYVRLSGIKRAGACHLFRHATATTMLDNGAELRHVQEMLGHASILTTQIYTHVSRAKLTEVYGSTHPSALSEQRLFGERKSD